MSFIGIFAVIAFSLKLNQTSQSLIEAQNNQKWPTCSQLATCEEAIQSYNKGNKTLDKGGIKGLPCESTLCKFKK